MTIWVPPDSAPPCTSQPGHVVGFWLAGAVLSLLGCSTWNADTRGVARLPRPQMSRDSVGLEIASVLVSGDAEQLMEQLGRDLDEQVMPAAQRRKLVARGFRCGRFSTHLPPQIRELLAATAKAQRTPIVAPVRTGLNQQRFVQCRAGRRREIITTPRAAKITVRASGVDAGQDETYFSAQCLFGFRCFPHGSHGATIEFTPEIEHGPLRQKYIGSDGTFRLETSRQHVTFEDLTMKVSLRPGETILLSCTPEKIGLGRTFFVDGNAGQQRIVLIRLAQLHADELFAEEKDAPLTSTAD